MSMLGFVVLVVLFVGVLNCREWSIGMVRISKRVVSFLFVAMTLAVCYGVVLSGVWGALSSTGRSWSLVAVVIYGVVVGFYGLFMASVDGVEGSRGSNEGA